MKYKEAAKVLHGMTCRYSHIRIDDLEWFAIQAGIEALKELQAQQERHDRCQDCKPMEDPCLIKGCFKRHKVENCSKSCELYSEYKKRKRNLSKNYCGTCGRLLKPAKEE